MNRIIAISSQCGPVEVLLDPVVEFEATRMTGEDGVVAYSNHHLLEYMRKNYFEQFD